jgi:hypothetical protein
MTKGLSVYESVTNAIIEELEQGVAPWVKPWSSGAAVSLPYNATSVSTAVSTSCCCGPPQWSRDTASRPG